MRKRIALLVAAVVAFSNMSSAMAGEILVDEETILGEENLITDENPSQEDDFAEFPANEIYSDEEINNEDFAVENAADELFVNDSITDIGFDDVLSNEEMPDDNLMEEDFLLAEEMESELSEDIPITDDLITDSLFCSDIDVLSDGNMEPIAVGTASNDYTQWKQGDSAWNQQEAWPASQYPGASMRWMSQAGCVVTSIAMLLRHYNVITTSDVNQFNPWICNERLKSASAFTSEADLYWGKVQNAFPGFVYAGLEGYSLSSLQTLYNQGYACIVKASSSHYVAVRSVSGSNVTIMDPGYNRTSLSAYSSPSQIVYYKPSGSLDSDKPTIEDVYIHDVDKNGYYIHCIVRDNTALGRVEFPTWTALNDQDDIIWGSAGAVAGNAWELNYRVNYSDHKNETSGTYYTDIYCYDAAGNLTTYKTVIHNPHNGAEMTSGYDRVLPDGDYMIASAGTTDKSSFYYMDIEGAAVPAPVGKNVSLCGAATNLGEYDIWTITYVNGFYTIKQKGTEMALDIENTDGNAIASGRNVTISNCHYGSNQQFAISQSGDIGYRIQAKCSGCSIDVAGGNISNGTNIQQYVNNNELAQKWLFIPYNPTQPIDEGKYILLPSAAAGMELDVSGDTGEVGNGINVQIWNDRAASRYNSFDLVKLPNGYYKFVHAASGKCLDVGGGSVTSSGNINLYDDNGSIAQQWAVIPNGDGYVVIARCSGYALDVWGDAAEDGTNVAQGYFHGGPNQTWTFVPAEYSVKYDTNGGSEVLSGQIKYYKQDLSLTTLKPTRNGFTFLGWSTSPTATMAEYAAGANYTKDEETTLYAVWKPNTYTISYNANGGTNAPLSQVKEYGKTLKLSETKPLRTGYTFLGWSTSPKAATAEYAVGSNYTKNEAATFYAVWKLNTYTITYSANGGVNAPLAQTKVYGVNLNLSTQKPTMSGFVFLGWATTASAKEAEYAPGDIYSVDDNATLYAVWNNGNTYEISYDANGGINAPASQKKNHSTAISLTLDTPSRTGYNFLGWAEDMNAVSAEYQSGAEFTQDKDTILYAVWKLKTYQVKYNANGGSGAPSAQQKEHGKALILSTKKPTRAGYAFLGWGTAKGATDAKYQPGGKYTANSAVTLYAVWEINTYSIVYDANGGDGAPDEQVKTYGESLEIAEDRPVKNGYNFLGWSEDANAATAEYTAGDYLEENRGFTLYAVWEAKTYTIKYNANGGSNAPASQKKTHGKTLKLTAAIPVRDEYEFLGWSSDKDAETAQFKAGADYTANKSVTLYAVWKEKTTERQLFDDVTDPDLFYFEPVYWAVDNGITTGYSDNTFRPSNLCHRAAVVTFLWRLAGKPDEGISTAFSDMTGNDDFDRAITWASNHGITTGYNDGTFRPYNPCHRAAIVTFIWRYAGKPEPSSAAGFSDMTNNVEFDKAIAWAAENNITTGYNDGTFRPYNSCLRLAVVTFLYRYAHL